MVYTRQTLEGLARLLERKGAEYGHPIYIIADEPYRELVYGGVEVPFIPTVYRNTIVCYSYSKSLSLPGERIGYICVPDFVEDHQAVYNAIAGAARSCGHVCPPTLIQLTIARCADELPDLAAYDENRQLLYRELTEMGYQCAKPDGAFYLFVKAPGGDDEAFCEKAKREHNLLVVPGTGFGEGGEGFVYRFAQQIDLRGNGEGLGHPELAGICFGHRRCGNRRFLDADKVFYVRGGAHDAALHEEVALCIRQAADRTLEPHGNNAHGIAFFELFGL